MTEKQDTHEFLERTFISGKALERQFELQYLLFEFSKLFDEKEENDRAIAIVGGAFLDTQLEHLLVNFLVDDEKEMRKLLQPDKPLGTYGNKVTMSYCLGFINGVVRDDLRTVAKIRNKFAHDLYASFDDEQIKSWCISLKWHRVSYMTPPSDATTRELFQVGVNCLTTYLSGMVSLARIEKRKAQPWS